MPSRPKPGTVLRVALEVGAPSPGRVDRSLECLAADEPVVALEDLLDNLHEYAVKITLDEHNRLVALANAWNVDTKALALLGQLDRD